MKTESSRQEMLAKFVENREMHSQKMSQARESSRKSKKD
jgi:hypothetical protein